MVVMDVEFYDEGTINQRTNSYTELDYGIMCDPEVLRKLSLYDEQVSKKS